MQHLTRLLIGTALIGGGFAAIMGAAASHLGYNIEQVLLGWVFGALAVGAIIVCDDCSSRNDDAGGK